MVAADKWKNGKKSDEKNRKSSRAWMLKCKMKKKHHIQKSYGDNSVHPPADLHIFFLPLSLYSCIACALRSIHRTKMLNVFNCFSFLLPCYRSMNCEGWNKARKHLDRCNGRNQHNERKQKARIQCMFMQKTHTHTYMKKRKHKEKVVA